MTAAQRGDFDRPTMRGCPTCGTPLAPRIEPAPCDAINPGTRHDVLPLRCTLNAGHDGQHLHPSLWLDTPPVQW